MIIIDGGEIVYNQLFVYFTFLFSLNAEVLLWIEGTGVLILFEAYL